MGRPPSGRQREENSTSPDHGEFCEGVLAFPSFGVSGFSPSWDESKREAEARSSGPCLPAGEIGFVTNGPIREQISDHLSITTQITHSAASSQIPNPLDFGCVVDNAHDAPVTDADAPLVFVSLAFCIRPVVVHRPKRPVYERHAPAIHPAALQVPSAPAALPQRNTYPRNRPRFTRSALIFSSGTPFSLGAILKSARPKNPLTPLRIVSDRFEPPVCGPSRR